MANEKVTLRFEEFDNDTDNTIISSGPISVYGHVNEFSDLAVLAAGTTFPRNVTLNNLVELANYDVSSLDDNEVVIVKDARPTRIGAVLDTLPFSGYPTGSILLLRIRDNNNNIIGYDLKINAGKELYQWEDLDADEGDVYMDVNTGTFYVCEYTPVPGTTDVEIVWAKPTATKFISLRTNVSAHLTYSNNRWEETIPNSDIVVFVRNVTTYSYTDPRSRGTYYRFDQFNQNWNEILIGSHSHENKEFLDRIGDFDLTTSNMGKGMLVLEVDSPDNGASFEYDVRFEEIPQAVPLLPEGNDASPLFLGVKNSGTAKVGMMATLTNSTNTVALENAGTVAGLLPGQKIVQTSPTNSGGVFGEYAVIETINYNNNTFTTNVNHIASGPVVFNIDIKREVEWNNRFIAPQTFVVRTTTIGDSANSVDFLDVSYDASLDEVLIIDDSEFISDRTINYNPISKVLTVSLPSSGLFSGNSKITLIVLRNGASSVLDEIAADYLTKEEAVAILSGGTINLDRYITKQDMRDKANRYHTHSHFAKREHDHDYRYAYVNHTHSQYITRAGAIKIIQDTLSVNPDIIDQLESISTLLEGITQANQLYIYNETWIPLDVTSSLSAPLGAVEGDIWKNGNEFSIYSSGTWELITVSLDKPLNPTNGDYYYMPPILNYILNSLPDITSMKDEINLVNDQLDKMFLSPFATPQELSIYTEEQLLLYRRFRSYLSTFTMTGEQILVTDYKTGEIKELQEVLDDLRIDIDEDLGTLESDNILIDTDIPVKLGEGNYVGEYDDGETLLAQQGDVKTSLTMVLRNLLQRRINPTYIQPEFRVDISGNLYPEHGSTVQTTFSIEFTQGDAGVLSQFNILANGNSIYDTSSVNPGQPVDNSIELTLDIPLLSAPVTLTVQAIYTDGVIKNNNFGEAAPSGRIVAGILSETFNFTPTDGILKGFSEDPLPSTNVGAYIRNNTTVHTAGNYEQFSHELVIPEGSRTIIFALPRNSNATVEKVLYKEQGNIDIIDLFTPSDQVSVNIYGEYSVDYDIYIYEMPVQTRSAMTLTFIR